MAVSTTRIQDNNDPIKPESREERIRKYLEEKKRIENMKCRCSTCRNASTVKKPRRRDNNEDPGPMSKEELVKKYLNQNQQRRGPYYRVKKKPPAVAKRLERRAEQRAFRLMTPEQKSRYRGYRNHRTNYLPPTILIGFRKYKYPPQVSVSIHREPLFRPTDKTKEKKKIGPLEGKDSWKIDYCPLALENVADTFNPGSVADKSETYKDTILKERKYRGRMRREKFTKPEKPIGNIYGDYISVPVEPQQKYKQERIVDTSYEQQKSKEFEDKLCDDIHALDQKSTSDRAVRFDVLRATLSKRLFPNTVVNYLSTITNALKRGLKKGHRAEQLAAARLAPIVCIQLGENYCEEFFDEVKSAFINLIMDKAVDTRVRAECCRCLAAISVLTSIDLHDMLDQMRMYEKIFSTSYSKNNCNTKESANADSIIQSAALNSWTLLLALCYPAEVHSLLNGMNSTFSQSLLRLIELLQAPTTEVRLAAGIGLSLAYELGSEYCKEFGRAKLDTVITEVEQLIADSHKFRSKKECRIQRQTFKKVLTSLEEKKAPVERVHVGKETLELDRWSNYIVYHKLATALGSGLQVAIKTNLLRSALHMEPPIHCEASQRPKKQEKMKTAVEWIYVGKETFESDRWSSHIQCNRVARERCPEFQIANVTSQMRSILRMEHPIHHEPPQWHNKEKKHLQYAAADKARTIARKKNRNKFYTDFNL